MQLRFNPFSSCNDPFEFYKMIQIYISPVLPFSTMEKLSAEFDTQIKKYSLICFSQDDEKKVKSGWKRPSMWAHYADNHQGVCLEFDFDETILKKFGEPNEVEYTHELPAITPWGECPSGNEVEWIRDTIEKYIDGLKSIAFFKKLSDWSVENEYRIIKKNVDSKDYYLPIKDSLTAVYLGIKGSEGGTNSNKANILKNLLEEKKIALYVLNDATLEKQNFYELKLVTELNKNRGKK
jgi:hypothetical protein